MNPPEAQLRIMIDTIPILAWCCFPDGSAEFHNRRWLEYTGFTLEESLGWGWKTALHPEDLDSLVGTWVRVLASGERGEAEARLRRFDGQYRWFLFRAEPWRDADGEIARWYGTTTDIEHIKRAEKELRDVIDYAPQQVAIIAGDGRRVYANRIALEYAGVTLEEFQSPEYDKLIHPEDLERITKEAPIGGSREYEFETRIRGKDGLYRWFLVRFFPLRDNVGNVLRWYSTGTEIQDRKQAEERVRNENLVLREEVDKISMFEEIVGTSPSLQSVLSRVTKVALTESTVLITGETGTGKELIARAIHKRSPRASRAFVSINCAAIPHSLITSELFGHEKGAFTGASQRRLGRFEMADGGTLFLDEVGDLPAETQIALLRILQEHQFERVGGNQPIQTNVRLIAATNRDLTAAIATGAFRSDLFYRLSVFPIEMPPLRKRQEDILMLVEYFIHRFATQAGKKITRIERRCADALKTYRWPGNVRELQNVVERSMILCEGETFSVDENWLPREVPEPPAPTLPLAQTLNSQEKTMIESALAETHGRVSGESGAAARLGMRPSTLESKIKVLRIDKHRFKSSSLPGP